MVMPSWVWWPAYDDAGPGTKRPLSLSTAIAAGILKRTINATRFIYFLYQVLQIALSPALILYLLYRGLRDPRYFTGMDERFGFLPPSFKPTGPGSFWFHAVSVGEVLSAVELIRRVKGAAARRDFRVGHHTGRTRGRRPAAGGAREWRLLRPLDYRSVIRRVLRRIRPAVVVVLETEIWPNLYRESKRAGASLMVVNGRISDRALPRYRRWRGFFKHVLRWPDAILVQSQQDRERYLMAGAPEERVRVAGNLKYDFTPPAAAVNAAELGGEPIWIAASTTAPVEPGDPDEDDVVIEAFKRVSTHYSGLLLIMAPRRPERFPVVAAKLAQAGVSYVIRSQSGFSNVTLPGVLLLDSIGELAGLFERATVVFMGGTLPQRGGHNILEPAYFGKPVIVGPHMENFAAIMQEFSAADAVVKIDGPDALAGAVESLLENPARAAEIGGRARAIAMAKRGTAEHVVEQILAAADEAVPDPPHTLEARLDARAAGCDLEGGPRREHRADTFEESWILRDQHRRAHHGRGGEVAVRRAFGAEAGRSGTEPGDPDAGIRPQIAPGRDRSARRHCARRTNRRRSADVRAAGPWRTWGSALIATKWVAAWNAN